MAHEQQVFDDTYEAGSDLTAKRFYAVNLASDGQVDVAGDGADAVGILQDDALSSAAGTPVRVRCLGLSKAISGAAVEEGARVASDANGKIVTAATGDFILGICKTPAANADEYLTIFVNPAGAKVPA